MMPTVTPATSSGAVAAAKSKSKYVVAFYETYKFFDWLTEILKLGLGAEAAGDMQGLVILIALTSTLLIIWRVQAYVVGIAGIGRCSSRGHPEGGECPCVWSACLLFNPVMLLDEWRESSDSRRELVDENSNKADLYPCNFQLSYVPSPFSVQAVRRDSLSMASPRPRLSSLPSFEVNIVPGDKLYKIQEAVPGAHTAEAKYIIMKGDLCPQDFQREQNAIYQRCQDACTQINNQRLNYYSSLPPHMAGMSPPQRDHQIQLQEQNISSQINAAQTRQTNELESLQARQRELAPISSVCRHCLGFIPDAMYICGEGRGLCCRQCLREASVRDLPLGRFKATTVLFGLPLVGPIAMIFADEILFTTPAMQFVDNSLTGFQLILEDFPDLIIDMIVIIRGPGGDGLVWFYISFICSMLGFLLMVVHWIRTVMKHEGTYAGRSFDGVVL